MDALPDTKLTMPESWRHSLCHLFNGNFRGLSWISQFPICFLPPRVLEESLWVLVAVVYQGLDVLPFTQPPVSDW